MFSGPFAKSRECRNMPISRACLVRKLFCVLGACTWRTRSNFREVLRPRLFLLTFYMIFRSPYLA
jgi:hypothetical protein